MIDTDKYEGHTPGPWEFDELECVFGRGPHPTEEPALATLHINEEFMLTEENMLANGKLIADAPLLLAEVKRLREIIQVQIVTPRSKDFFFQHYGKDDFEERWKEWADGIQDRIWGRKND